MLKQCCLLVAANMDGQQTSLLKPVLGRWIQQVAVLFVYDGGCG